jgi:hypothetical protein
MRMLLNVSFPHEPFNELVRKGKIGATLDGILKGINPEAVYFTEHDGKRAAIIIVDVKEPSSVPAIAEPFFLKFQADLRFQIVMNPEELAKSGIDKLAKKWS